MTISPEYEIGATVYPKIDPSSENGAFVTGYVVRENGLIIYLTSDADGDEKERFGFELTDTVQWSTPRDES